MHRWLPERRCIHCANLDTSKHNICVTTHKFHVLCCVTVAANVVRNRSAGTVEPKTIYSLGSVQYLVLGHDFTALQITW